MIRINKYKYKIEQTDRDLAEKNNWAEGGEQKENTFIGNLGEICACKYLDINWNPVEYSIEDLNDDDKLRYQVKTCKEKGYSMNIFLDQKEDWKKGFERYILCYIDEKEEYIYIEGDMTANMAHANKHIQSNYIAIYRK